MNALFRWPLVPLSRDVEWFFDNAPETLPAWWQSAAGTPGSFPALNVWSDDDAVHVEAEVPGLRLEQLELTIAGDQLTLAGERPEVLEPGVTRHRSERAVGRFSRTLTLPFPIEPSRVDARLVDGVLAVDLPKAQAVRPVKVEIKASR
jgi:HSP20 family protein